jgi:hypothetical protein
MPRKRITEAIPRGKPKAAPELVSTPEPIQAPKVRAIRRPIVTPTVTPNARPEAIPENTVYFAYPLEQYNTPGAPGFKKCHPKFYGDCLGEFITERDTRNFLKRNGLYGAFAIAERVNERFRQSWPIEIEEPKEIETGADDSQSIKGLGYLDETEIDDNEPLDPRIVKRDIRIARLESKLEAQSNGHTRNGYDPLTETIYKDVLPELIRPKSLAEQLREHREIDSMIYPPRRESPAPAPAPQPQRSEEEVLISAVARNPEIADKLTTGLFRKFLGGESLKEGPTWEDVAMKAVENGEASKLADALVNLVSTGLGSLASAFAPKPAQAPNPAQAPQQPQATQAAQQAQANQGQPAQAPLTVSVDSNPQPVQATQPPLSPQDEFISTLVSGCQQNTPIEQVRNYVNLALIRNPELEDSLDQLLNLPTDQLLALAVSIHPPVAQTPHAKTWLESLVSALTAEGEGDFDQFVEIDSRKGEKS